MDVRREWEQDEIMLCNWLERLNVPVGLVLTKIDKLTKNEMAKAEQRIKKTSKVKNIFFASAPKKVGMREIEEFIYEKWVKPNLEKPKSLFENTKETFD